MENKPKPKTKPTKKKNHKQTIWTLKILILSFVLSLSFGILSEIVLNGTGIFIAVLIIVIFVGLSIIFDMIGVSVTAAKIQPFRAMASKKVRGAKEAIKLLLKADRVSSICCDVIGDVCGILSGAAGASIVVKIAIESNSFLSVIIASLISAIVASLTIFGKSICKKYAIEKSSSIVLIVGKTLSLFKPQRKNKNTKTKTITSANEDTTNNEKTNNEKNIDTEKEDVNQIDNSLKE